jgi:hypothetical protein
MSKPYSIQEMVDGEWKDMIVGYEGADSREQAEKDLRDMIRDTGYNSFMFRIYPEITPADLLAKVKAEMKNQHPSLAKYVLEGMPNGLSDDPTTALQQIGAEFDEMKMWIGDIERVWTEANGE